MCLSRPKQCAVGYTQTDDGQPLLFAEPPVFGTEFCRACDRFKRKHDGRGPKLHPSFWRVPGFSSRVSRPFLSLFGGRVHL